MEWMGLMLGIGIFNFLVINKLVYKGLDIKRL